jgi:hypothetical protein
MDKVLAGKRKEQGRQKSNYSLTGLLQICGRFLFIQKKAVRP